MGTPRFYQPDGQEAVGAGLAEARKYGFVPSVTTILGIVNKEGINRYRVRQMMEAALTLPRQPFETDDEFIERLEDDAQEHSRKAAALGTAVHHAIEHFWHTGCFGSDTLPESVEVAHEDLAAVLDRASTEGQTETGFANQSLGYGGRIDFFGYRDGTPIILDYKTQDVHEGLQNGAPKFRTYPEWALQLSAYRRALSMAPGQEEFAEAKCFTILISTSSRFPGVKVKEWPANHVRFMNLTRAWRQFELQARLFGEIGQLPPVVEGEATSLSFKKIDQVAA